MVSQEIEFAALEATGVAEEQAADFTASRRPRRAGGRIGRTHMTIGETLALARADREPEPPGRRAGRPAGERQAHRPGRGPW